VKIKITCPGCQKRFVLDADAAGEEFFCPSCMTRIRIGQPANEVAEPTTAAPIVATPTPEEVVCPRCNLHFKLKSQGAIKGKSDRPRILIVEEPGYFRQTAENALSTHCKIETAASVSEAEKILANGRTDLMILDITLNDGEGKQLLRAGGLKPCPILIYTAEDVSEMYGQAWEELQRLGADDIAFQGMNVEESLSRKVAALLGKQWDDDAEHE